MRLPGLGHVPGLGGWDDDPVWGHVYDWIVEHPRAGGVVWGLGMQSDLRRLYAVAAEVSRLPDGARVLDVPCGGGVALRGLRPEQDVAYVAADIAPEMLERTARAAQRRGVAHLVEPRRADVADLPFADGEFDLVVSLTGLHCFPEPARAVVEMVRVLRPGGVLVGSTLLNDAGLRFAAMRTGGRLSGLLGPGCTGTELESWLRCQGCDGVVLERSGALGYYRAVRR